ncbi:MAG: membrane protein insertase YidC [Clostridia bacterium]
MASLDYPRRKKLQIIAIVLLLLVCVLVLVACNKNDGIYDVSGAEISLPTHFMAKFMLNINDNIGNFGWTVVVFTIVLRLILSPIDFWQKFVARKNAKAMERMKPQLEVLQEKLKDDKERYQQEQMALYKKEHYSMMGACLPTIVTMVVFMVVFAGFRQMVGYQFALDYKNSYNVFETAFTAGLEAEFGEGAKVETIEKTEANAEKIDKIISDAQDKVSLSYYSQDEVNKRSFLWIKNIFVPDTWKHSVPDHMTVTGQTGFATSKLEGVMVDEYNLVMAKVLNTGGWGKGGSWNGWLLLPALSIVLSFLSTKLMSKSQGAPPAMPQGDKKGKDGKPKGGMEGSMKMMQYMMPVMMGVFAVMYSGAFALYMFVSSLCALLFQGGFDLVAKIVDVTREKRGIVKVKK